MDPGGVSRDGSWTDELPDTTESLELSGRAWRSGAAAASGEATDCRSAAPLPRVLFLDAWLGTHSSTMSRDVTDIHGD